MAEAAASAYRGHKHECDTPNDSSSPARRFGSTNRTSSELGSVVAKLNSLKTTQLERSKSIPMQHIQATSKRPWLLQVVAGNKPMLCPSKVPLDLLFFRRIFSNLHRRYGNGEGEVPVAVFQRSVVRLFKVLGMMGEFDASEYDVDGSGAVGWYEFVTVWQRAKMSVNLSAAERAFLAMEDPSTCFLGQMISVFVTMLILFSCVCFILGTLPSLRDNEGCPTCEPVQPFIFDVLEGICVGVFTLEYIARLVLAPLSRSELLDYEKILEFVTEHQDLSIPTCQRRLIIFLITPMNVIDLFVIAPFYFELFLGFVWSNLTVLRVLRLTRLFRLMKLGRYFEVLQLIIRVMNKALEVLNVLFFYLILAICFSAALMHVVEGGTWDPDLQDYVRTSHEGETSISPFKSIPHACWWCIVTFTTVGYGDVVPVTIPGKLIASAIMMAGVLVLAMPISAISLNFGQVWEEWVEERRMDQESRHLDILSVTKALQGMESRNRLLLDVYDDSGGGGTPEFLGEVELKDLPVDSDILVKVEATYKALQPNLDKKPSEKIQGMLMFGYTWRPQRSQDASGGFEPNNVRGTLEVWVDRAYALPASDWKKEGLRNVYVEVNCWPSPPNSLQEDHRPQKFRTRTVDDTLEPVWTESCQFSYDWPRDWRPVEEQMFGHASKQWSNVTSLTSRKSRDLSRIPSGGDGNGTPSNKSSEEKTSHLDRRNPPMLPHVVTEDVGNEDSPDHLEEMSWKSRRLVRTASKAEKARMLSIHDYYRQKRLSASGDSQEPLSPLSPMQSGDLSLDAARACELNARFNGDALPPHTNLLPLSLPQQCEQNGVDLQALTRCVEAHGRELQSLSGHVVEIRGTLSRLEALLSSGRGPEADTQELGSSDRAGPLFAPEKEATELEEHLPAPSPTTLPAMPGLVSETEPPAGRVE